VYEYDLVVVGCGPAGQRAAIAAAKLGKRAAIIERADSIGGVCVNTGTLPSKTLRETVLYLTGLAQRELYGQSHRVKTDITIDDLMARTIVIATGTKPARPANIAFEAGKVIDSDGILKLQHIPASLVVVGAGVIGIEYASIFAALGSKVTVVERRDKILEFCDDEVVQALQYHLRSLHVTFRPRETVSAVQVCNGRTLTVLASGKTIPADAVMYSAGRIGATSELGLEALGIAVDDRGRIKVDEHFRTAVPSVYAVGDVIGFPALAATSMEQGRLAAYHAFGEPTPEIDRCMPIGIYPGRRGFQLSDLGRGLQDRCPGRDEQAQGGRNLKAS
jgi:NAD(P) transhydrogenase